MVVAINVPDGAGSEVANGKRTQVSSYGTPDIPWPPWTEVTHGHFFLENTDR